MKHTKKGSRVLRSIFGWLLIGLGGFSGLTTVICALAALFGRLEIDSFAERLALFITYLVMTAGFFAILRLGIRLKNGGRKKAAAPVKTPPIPRQENEAGEYLDDVTFILGMRHIAASGWQQYDVVLDAAGYGWDTMKDWADYLSGADLEHISEVQAGIMGEAKTVTQSYIDHGGKCTQTPELDVEQGILSVAGMSRVLHAPVKIVWINQTNRLRLFTAVEDESAVRKYVETAVRRTFGTENAMKLGKPAPKKETPEKLNLGTFSFSDADRQKLAELPKKGLPEKLDTADAQLALLDVLDSVMNTAVVRLKTDALWNTPAPDERSETEKINRLRGNVGAVILSVDASLSVMNPDYLRKKVECADYDQLLNVWTVLNYYADLMKPEYAENIRHFRDYIHNALLTHYSGAGGKCPVPATLDGTGIYVESAALLEWLSGNRLTPQYELLGVMPLEEKEPVITLYEDGVKTREYRLQTEEDEDFTGKFFHISVRMGMQGSPSVPTVQIDGFVSDTPEERGFTLKDVGYRMEGHFLACGGENAQKRREMNRGQDLPMKALKYPGYTTPSNIRLVGICPDCGKSFCFHGYAFYMGQNDVAYSDDGLDCCQVSAHNIANDDWKYEAEGKTFRYYNSFCCPHCGTPYIDYRKFPENKSFGVSGCVLLGRKVYNDTAGQ